MASAAVIGALKVILGGDTSDLDKSLKGSQSKIAAFGSMVGTAMAAAGAAVVTAAAAIGYSVKRTIDEADKMGKMAQSIGVPVEELSRLNYAAKLSDVSLEALGKNVGKLARNMVEAAGDGVGPAADAFKTLDISVTNTDGTLKTSSEVIGEVAGRFGNMADGAGKTALAMAIFGKSGADMIPMLNAGKDGLKAMTDEAGALGVVIDAKTSKASEAFNDNLTRLGAVFNGMFVKITARMLPALLQFSQMMIDAAKNSKVMEAVADGIVVVFKGVVTAGLTVIVAVQRISAELSALWQMAKLFGQGEFSAGIKVWSQASQETDAALKGLGETVSRFWGDAAAGAEAAAATAGPKLAAPIIQAAAAGENAVAKFLAGQAKRIAGMNAEAQTVGLSVGAHEKLRVQLEAEALAKERNIPLTEALRLKIAATGDAAALAAMKVAGAQAAVAAMNPTETFNLQMTQLRELYDAGVISLETFGARQQQIAEAAQATWGQAGESIAGSFATIAGAFSKESKGMAIAAKAFGIVQGTISMFTGAAKALELPFPANLAAMAAVLAKGASMVASIKSTSVPTGMMTGGSIMVRGGGGPDSVPVNMRVSPGEQIDVWRPDQGGGQDPRRGSGSAGVINLSMPIAATRDAFRALIEGINEMTADGYRLNVVPA